MTSIVDMSLTRVKHRKYSNWVPGVLMYGLNKCFKFLQEKTPVHIINYVATEGFRRVYFQGFDRVNLIG